MFGRFTIVARNLGKPFFRPKKCLCKNKNIFSEKILLVSLPPKNQTAYCLNPYWRTVFPQISKALGHQRVQFTLVGLFSGSQLQQAFPELILEPREGKTPFTKAVEKFKVQAFPTRIRPHIKPLLKNGFSTNFQSTGAWEGPVHFSRFVIRVHNCSKLFQSWSSSRSPSSSPSASPFPSSSSSFSSSSSSFSLCLFLFLVLSFPFSFSFSFSYYTLIKKT